MKIGFNHFLVLTLLLVLLASAAVACGQKPDPAGDGAPSEWPSRRDGRIVVVVSIVPQKYFVERVGGDTVNVSVMVEPGASPATYEPKPEQLKALSGAAAYFSIGVPFEDAWLAKIAEANVDMMMVDTIADVERVPMGARHQAGEAGVPSEWPSRGEGVPSEWPSRGEGVPSEWPSRREGEEDEEDHEHAAGVPDPHVWLSPELVKVQSRAMYETLAQLDPAHQDEYAANLDAFIAEIDALEADVRASLSGLESNKFMVFHPAWGYFARDFGLEQIPVEVGGQEPSAQELAYLIEVAKQEGIQVIFAQPEFSTQDAETIAQEIDGEVLLISPLAPDWLENMRQVAQTFADVLNR